MAEFTTLQAWATYADKRDQPSPTTATDEQNAEAALARADDYIRFHYFNKFAQEFRTTPLPAEVAELLAAATAIAASQELVTPDIFTTIAQASTATFLSRIDDIEFEQVHSGISPADLNAYKTKHTTIDEMLNPYFTATRKTSAGILVVSP